jgi:hypothetical protein
VSDEISSRLRDLQRAAEPPRYRLLRHAAANGSIRARDAASIAQLDPTTGTTGYHLRELVKYDLLMQSPDGEYVPTRAGRRIEQVLSGFLDKAPAPEGASTVVLLAFADETVRERLAEVLPDATSLTAVLQSRIEGRRLQPAGTLTVSRTAGPR